MAKNKLKKEKPIKKKEKKVREPKPKRQKKTSPAMEALFDLGARIIDGADELVGEIGELLVAGKEGLFEVAAHVIIGLDHGEDVLAWGVSKSFVTVARRYHEARVRVQAYRREIIKYFLGGVIVAAGLIAIFAAVTDYEYTYNGRALGIVRDQQDVLEIMDLVSEELTQEYGSNVSIDPETDITFRPVMSYGKEIDDADTVLKKFTYMGDIQAQAYGIYAEGELIAVLESEEVAKEVLNEVLEYYTDRHKEYESVGFAEKVEILPYNTTLANVTSRATAFKKIKSGGQQEVTYTVQAGDTISGICQKLDVSMGELYDMNPQLKDSELIHVGDEYVISQEIPLLTVETVEVATYAKVVKYKTVEKESSAYYEGDEVVSREGKNGKARVTARLTKRNGQVIDEEVLSKEVIKKPVSKIVIKGTKKVPPKQGTGTYIRPVNVPIYSGFGWRWGRMHQGVDLPAGVGTPIHAADGGTVTMAGWSGAYGLTVVIDHGGGVTTLYAHCSALYVSVGERVFQGQTIAAVGTTGRVTGAHCHFEIRVNGVHVNPANYI